MLHIIHLGFITVLTLLFLSMKNTSYFWSGNFVVGFGVFLRGVMWFIFLNGYASLLIFIEGMGTFSRKKKNRDQTLSCLQ